MIQKDSARSAFSPVLAARSQSAKKGRNDGVVRVGSACISGKMCMQRVLIGAGSTDVLETPSLLIGIPNVSDSNCFCRLLVILLRVCPKLNATQKSCRSVTPQLCA
jgi:hypothetical protein